MKTSNYKICIIRYSKKIEIITNIQKKVILRGEIKNEQSTYAFRTNLLKYRQS